eukprot:7379838-Prymnesium_polylepis.1
MAGPEGRGGERSAGRRPPRRLLGKRALRPHLQPLSLEASEVEGKRKGWVEVGARDGRAGGHEQDGDNGVRQRLALHVFVRQASDPNEHDGQPKLDEVRVGVADVLDVPRVHDLRLVHCVAHHIPRVRHRGAPRPPHVALHARVARQEAARARLDGDGSSCRLARPSGRRTRLVWSW